MLNITEFELFCLENKVMVIAFTLAVGFVAYPIVEFFLNSAIFFNQKVKIGTEIFIARGVRWDFTSRTCGKEVRVYQYPGESRIWIKDKHIKGKEKYLGIGILQAKKVSFLRHHFGKRPLES